MRERTGELRYTSAPRRRDEILRRMRSAGYVSAPDLSADLSVSGRTVRRDLQKLADLGLVELVYGGALAPGGVTPGSPFGARSQAQSSQKRAIADRALRFVEAGATIGVDAGTTTLELARMLPPDGDVTVVTHSLPAMGALRERSGATLIGLGGLHHPSTQAFIGIAERVVLLADSAKLRQTAPVPICDYDRIDVLITDDAITDADR
jgi:DeoR family fructose operon transcriptional repressor